MKNLIRIFNQKKAMILLVIFLLGFYIAVYKIYIPRVNAFGCFDDCFNFMGGYFLLHGKRLFSEIFFNHSPFMAYLSAIIQFFTHPQNLYELILRHRQVLIIYSLVFNLILLIRFKYPILGFVIFYELTKFYLFGDRFLAEGFIVYPFAYLVGLVILKINLKKITSWDYLFSGLLIWLILFMREPYVPAALFIYIIILWGKENLRLVILSLATFTILSLITVFYHNVNEFIFNVITVNVGRAAVEDSNIFLVIVRALFYPINLLFGGEWGYFRYIIVALDSIFLVSLILLFLKKQYKLIIFIWILLGLLNLRFVEPGKAFYGAFHLLCWYGIFIFISFMLLAAVYRFYKRVSVVLIIAYGVILLFHLLSPASFLRSKPDPHWDLITNYGIPMQVGMVINSISKPSDSVFLDGFDDIIYWQAQRYSFYKYSWYTSFMPNYKKYTDERIAMFRKSPPDFYYGSCPKEQNPDKLLPEFIKASYVNLYSDKKPSCLWVKKTKIARITTVQRQKAEALNYFLP